MIIFTHRPLSPGSTVNANFFTGKDGALEAGWVNFHEVSSLP